MRMTWAPKGKDGFAKQARTRLCLQFDAFRARVTQARSSALARDLRARTRASATIKGSPRERSLRENRAHAADALDVAAGAAVGVGGALLAELRARIDGGRH